MKPISIMRRFMLLGTMFLVSTMATPTWAQRDRGNQGRNENAGRDPNEGREENRGRGNEGRQEPGQLGAGGRTDGRSGRSELIREG